MDGFRQTSAVDYGPEEAAMQAYLSDGERRAAALGNRGPIRFTPSGELHRDIVEAYWRCGFYVFEGVLKQAELSDIEHDLHGILDRLPVERGAPLGDARRVDPAGEKTVEIGHWNVGRQADDVLAVKALDQARHRAELE